MSMTVTFLGTNSGGGPTESRNCSSLVCDMLRDKSLWMVDCAEGTARQFALQPSNNQPLLRLSKISKIFITHMHADHIMGIVPLLRNMLYPPLANPAMASNFPQPRTVEIYGPAGLRLFVRQIMKMTLTRTSDKYVVHELLTAEDTITPCDPAPASEPASLHTLESNILHPSEVVGENIICGPDGCWRAITEGKGTKSPIIVDAGAILHRDPCIGYTFTEIQFPSRKLVILGDTYDPSPMLSLCTNPSPSLLVHEATDSCISQHADPSGKLSRRSAKEVKDKALERGHSVPEMAGAFAKQTGARDLVLNHISGRFPAPRNPRDYGRQKIMQDIEHRASVAWGSGKRVTAAWDFLRVSVPFHERGDEVGSTSSIRVRQASVEVVSYSDDISRHTQADDRSKNDNRPAKRRSNGPGSNSDKKHRKF